jgi:Zn-dependent protease/CBS domain-containing protein
MNRRKIPLGRISGIPIGLDCSWFLAFGLLIWNLAVNYYPDEFENWSAAQCCVAGAATAVLFLASVLIHELGHSAIALWHKVPVRSITLFVFGGVSEMEAKPPNATAELRIAIAGPVVSLALAMFFALLQPVVAGAALFLALTRYLAYINCSLAILNLIPGFPLDGGRIFRAIVWAVTHDLRRATLIAANLGRAIAYVFVFWGVWSAFREGLGEGLWIAFIGWFLRNAAVAQVQRQRIQDRLVGHTVSQAMSRDLAVILAETSVQQLADRHILSSERRSVAVQDGDKVVGLLTSQNAKATPPADWPTTTVAQVMIPAAQLETVRPGTDLWTALEQMNQDGANQLAVMKNGQVMGVLSRRDVVIFLQDRPEPGSCPR